MAGNKIIDFSRRLLGIQPRLTIVGLTRFSLVTQKTLLMFRSTRDKRFEDVQREIYDPARMEHRFRLFEAFCLPTYAALSDAAKQSHGLVLIAASMPKEYKERLRSAVAATPSVHVVELRDDEHPIEATARETARIANGSRLYAYRLDDDDALSPSFASEVERYGRHAPNGSFLSFDMGMQIGRYEEDEYRINQRDWPLIALGLGIYSSAPDYQTPFAYRNHSQIGRKAPVIHHRDPGYWLRSTHGTNDSRLGRMKADSIPGHEALIRLSRYFPQLNEAALTALPIRQETHA